MKNVMFAEVPVGSKFFFGGNNYIKAKNQQNGKLGAVNVVTGQYYSDCSHWSVVIDEVEEVEKPLNKLACSNKLGCSTPTLLQVILTYDYNSDPAIFTMTDEQFNLFKILYENDFLGDDTNYAVIGSDNMNYFDATK